MIQAYVSLTGMLLSFYFVSCVYYLRKSAVLNYKLWDINMVTPVDWTVQIDIPHNVWIKWQNLVYMNFKIKKAMGR